MTDTLFALSLLALVALACCGAGRALLDICRVRSWQGGLERTVFAIALGMGALAYLVLAAGLLGGLRAPTLTFFVALPLAVLGGPQARRALAEIWASVTNRKPGVARPPFWMTLSGAALALFALCTLVGALAPPAGLEWDTLSYHLAGPKTYLREGRIFYIPYDHHTNFPFTLQMLYTLLLSVGSVGGAKLWHWLCGALLVASVYTFAVRHVGDSDPARGRPVGLIAALIVASTPIVLWEASVAYVDLATALFTWLSLYALFNAAQAVAALTPFPSPKLGRGVPVTNFSFAARQAPEPSATGTPLPILGEGKGVRAATAGEKRGDATPDSVPWLIVSALLMGLALGTKLTVLGFWGMLLVGIVGWHVATTGKWAKQTIPHAVLWGGASLALAAPWFVKSWRYTGNPVYPFFYGIFGGRYWSGENAALYAKDQAAFGFGKTPLDLLLAPWQVTMEAGLLPPNRPFVFTEYVIFGLSPVYVGLVLAAPLLTRRLSRPSVLLALFGLGVFGFWFFLMQQTRYLIPALPALAVVAAETLLIAWAETKIARWFGGALAAASMTWGLYLAAVFLAAPALPVVTGRETRQAYLNRNLPGLAPAVDFINREMPPKAKVALFDEVRGFYLDRPYVWATPNHAAGLLPWDSYENADDWLTDFSRRGYTILLVNRRNAPKPPDAQKWRRLLLEAVTSGQVRLAFSDRGVDVYQITEPPTP